MSRTTRVLGHRGASAYAPENTMAAFELAADQGADGLEIDIQPTRDGVVVVLHDDTVDRTSDGTGRVVDLTFDEVRALRFDRGFEDAYAGERIPSLAEVLDLVAARDLYLNIEVKGHDGRYATLAAEAARTVRERGLVDQVIFSSFHHTSMAELKREHPDVATALLHMMDLHEIGEYGRRAGADALHPGYLGLSPLMVHQAREAGLAVNGWTMPQPFTSVTEVQQIADMLDLGLDAVITNVPDVCVAMADAR
jgi:glycerophosphoryl diester phosphodiesterase